MADPNTGKSDPRYGKGTARVDTIKDLTAKREQAEEQKRKAMFREQIIFFLIAACSVAPWVVAWNSKDSNLSMQMFKVGAVTLISLYPLYLLIRAIISIAVKGKKSK